MFYFTLYAFHMFSEAVMFFQVWYIYRNGTVSKDSNCRASMPTAEALQYTTEKKSLSCTAARVLRQLYIMH